MLSPGETLFARSGDVDIAYQVVGQGEQDILVGIGWASHLEVLWELPETVHFLERLAACGRLILFDARGTGLSDRPPGPASIPDLVDDVVAVLDAAGSARAALVGWLDKAALSLAVAARHPDRVSALVLGEALAVMRPPADGPTGLDPAALERVAAAVESGAWGQGTLLPWISASAATDPRVAAWWRRWERMSATPNMAAAQLRTLLDMDVRDTLPQVGVPVLLLHRTSNPLVPTAGVRWLAGELADCRLVELPGGDLAAFFGDTDALMDEVEDFLRGTRTGSTADHAVLTLLVTDVAGSTAHVAEVGDRRWTELLDWHHREVRDLLERHGGHEVDTAGDGFLAAFDLPSRAVACALAIRDRLASGGVAVRVGLHAGEVVRVGGGLRGIAVHAASRVAAEADPGEVLVSATVRDLLLGSSFGFSDRAEVTLRGLPGQWRLMSASTSGP